MIDRADGSVVDEAAGVPGFAGVAGAWPAGEAGFGFGGACVVCAATVADRQERNAAARRTEPRRNIDRPLARSKWLSRILKLLWCVGGLSRSYRGKSRMQPPGRAAAAAQGARLISVTTPRR